MNVGYSLLTITHGRDRHLAALVRGAFSQDVAPAEIVVVYMDQPIHPQLDTSGPIVEIDVSGNGTLPLASARNCAARNANEQRLVFLDVDCIPSGDFASRILSDLDEFGGLVMGSPRYLPAGHLPEDADLRSLSQPHSTRTALQSGRQNEYSTFWSLCFAVTARDFRTAGGFDETFTGYGAEDTDFALSFRDVGIGYAISDAEVYHQHHETFRPPLNHFAEIVANARTFRSKRGCWPMEGWLTEFADRGLIRWSSTADSIEIVRHPEAAEIAEALVA